MFLKFRLLPILLMLLTFIIGCQQIHNSIKIEATYPWCIVAYDSLERTPSERIKMIKDLGFTKYAYDWREKNIQDTKTELILAQENDIEIISVWIWLNPKRDSVSKLSPPNEKMFYIVDGLKLKTTFWVGLSEDYFKDLSQEESLEKSIDLIRYVSEKAKP